MAQAIHPMFENAGILAIFVKNVPAAKEYMPDAVFEIPYEGGSPMLLVDDVDDRDYLTGLIEAVYPELPETKKRSR